jgi:hypothetical protein
MDQSQLRQSQHETIETQTKSKRSEGMAQLLKNLVSKQDGVSSIPRMADQEKIKK